MMYKIFLFVICVILLQSDIALAQDSNKVILITLDGVRWQEMLGGTDPFGNQVDSRALLPNIYNHFVDHGVVFGKESLVKVSGPAHISMPGYLEILRGYGTFDCLGNDCKPNKKPTLVNQFPNNAAVFASWHLINRIVDSSPVLSTGRKYRNQVWKNLALPNNTSFPVAWDPEYRPDAYTIIAVKEYYNKFQPQFLWVSLGDTDEYAHAGDYPGYLNALRQADKFIGEMMVASKGTTIILSPDHGRGNDWRNHGWDTPSARTWIMMAGNKVPSKGFVKAKVELHQSNIFPTVLHLTKNINSPNSLLNQ